MKNKKILLSLFLATFLNAESEMDNGSTIISSKEIRSLNTQMLVDLLNKLPGIKASDSFISLQGSTTNEVLVLFDGRPLTDSLTGTASLGGISTENLEKIEIIKGSGAALYGDNTSGGVIVITSKKTNKSYVNKINIAKGSLNTEKVGLNIGKTFDGFGLAFDVNHDKTDGHRLNGDSEINSAKIDFNTLIAKEYDFSLTSNYLSDKAGVTGKITSPTPNARNEKESFGTSMLLKNNGFEGRLYTSRNDDLNTNPDVNLDTFLKTVTYGSDLKYSGDMTIFGKAVLGVNGENRSAEATNSGSHSEDLVGLYGMKQFEHNNLGYNLGMRLNNHSTFGNSVNPELGISYNLNDTKYNLKITQSSKTPTFKQRYYESSTVKGNPNLEMESTTNYQVGLSSKINDDFNLNGNIFYSKIDDGISGSYDVNGVYTYENVTSSTRKGFEMSLDWKINEIFKMDASYLYLIFKNDNTGLYLPAKPKQKFQSNIYAVYQNFKANLGGYYVSDSFNNSANTEVLQGYFLANSKIEYKYKNMKFYMEIENLLDKAYEVHIGYPSAGRTYLFGINYLF
ncbi:MAG: TonB-dependent receptor [Arcobacteraceae bacterium]|jgi:iron complex outermembrane receptor protein|nr:TonB-dependent receptor [Arcobacteraceae bacterium]